MKKKPGLFFQSPQTDTPFELRTCPGRQYLGQSTCTLPHVRMRHVSLGDTSRRGGTASQFEEGEKINTTPYFLRSFWRFLKKKPGLFFQSPQTDPQRELWSCPGRPYPNPNPNPNPNTNSLGETSRRGGTASQFEEGERNQYHALFFAVFLAIFEKEARPLFSKSTNGPAA